MNVKRFTGRTARDALAGVKQAFGDDAVVLSTKPCADGVEVLAMAPDAMNQIEAAAQTAPTVRMPPGGAGSARSSAAPAAGSPGRAPARAEAQAQAQALALARVPRPPGESLRAAAQAALRDALANDAAAHSARPSAPREPVRPSAPREPVRPAAGRRIEPRFDADGTGAAPVEQDVTALSMSTLSFQDYVRERMLKRRQAEIAAAAADAPAPSPVVPFRQARVAAQPAAPAGARRALPVLHDEVDVPAAPVAPAGRTLPPAATAPMREGAPAGSSGRDAAPSPRARSDEPTGRREQAEMMSELRSMKGLIEQRFGALAFMEKLQRSPEQAQLTQRLLEGGWSPALIRKLGASLPTDAADPLAWAAGVLERNLHAAEQEPAIEDVPGVYALIGSTGVGKTTTTAKIAAAFASRHGAGNLGLITLDAYRVAAHEQMRTYGRILGVPVHTAHDRASLEDLLELLSAKKMVLIDTAGMAQRDSRTGELLDMLSHRAIQKLLVVNAASQGETIEDVVQSWRAAACRGVVLSKIDEAVKLAPALDAMIRHRLRVLGVANGQRVPEDWHRLSATALVQRAMRPPAVPAYQMDAGEVNLVFAALPAGGVRAAARV